jgi:hypothetical protein
VIRREETGKCAQGSVKETTDGLTELEGALLSSITKQGGKRDDGDEGNDKVGGRTCSSR